MSAIPNELFTIRDLETLRVIADPLRMQIVELLIPAGQTVKQVADRLGLASSKLYYHFSLLEKHALIEVAETRMVANMIERVYRATARDIEIDPSLLSISTDEGREAARTYITPTFDATREDLLRSLQARSFQLEQGAEQHLRHVLITREVSHIPDERVDEFLERLKALIKDFTSADQGEPSADSPSHALMVAYYPSFYFDSPTTNGND
jgi:DNA-binding transcriptional ArsR family regulator